MLFVPIMTTAGGCLDKKKLLFCVPLVAQKKEVNIDRRTRREPHSVASCILRSDEART